MIGAKPTRISFSPALPCVDCAELPILRLISPMSSQMWQLVPVCNEPRREPTPEAGKERFASASDLQQHITNDLRMIEQLRRRRLRIARAFLQLRRQRAHPKAQRALRWRLNHAYRLQAEAMEVES